jgi:phosphatidylserine/phosphatidylglycerophosphate/cardiolipin synthase-like enzyme
MTLLCALALLFAQDLERGWELVETAPVETTLDHPDLREAHVVWPEMIARARRTLDLGYFYASGRPGSRLEPTLAALDEAAARGVRVRFLIDERFTGTDAETKGRLAAIAGAELRELDLSGSSGGVLHAKYMVIDGREVFVGSQNFDWRSLEHIQELGLRVVDERVARMLADVFEGDWARAAGMPAAEPDADQVFPARFGSGDELVQLTPVFSPKGLLPDPGLWDLPRLVELVDSAERRVRLQLLSYHTTDREGRYFDAIESALRRAAAREVEVELLLADWSKREGQIEGLQSLQALPGITVKLVTLPQWSGGFIPYARVVHAKYLVADGRRAWLGTSNFSRDYFHASRNVGFLIDGPALAGRLDAFFDDLWRSSYAVEVDPGAKYEPPRVGE